MRQSGRTRRTTHARHEDVILGFSSSFEKPLVRPPLLAVSAAPAPAPACNTCCLGCGHGGQLVSALHHLPSARCLRGRSDPCSPAQNSPPAPGPAASRPSPSARVLRDLLWAPGSLFSLIPCPALYGGRCHGASARSLFNAIPSAGKRPALLHPAPLTPRRSGGLTSSLDQVGSVTPCPQRPGALQGTGSNPP